MVGVSVQLSNWYNLKPSHRRMLALLMLRSQREAIIKAGFYEASLANFMAVISSNFISFISTVLHICVQRFVLCVWCLEFFVF